MKIGKSEKKHFCDKNLAALKGSTERDHQAVGEAQRACKNCRHCFQKDHSPQWGSTVPRGGRYRSREVQASFSSSDRIMEEFGLRSGRQTLGKCPSRFPDGKAQVAQRSRVTQVFTVQSICPVGSGGTSRLCPSPGLTAHIGLGQFKRS